jgi:hypothetical protein
MTLKLLAETYLLLRSRSSWVPGGCPSQCGARRVDGGFTLSWQPCSSLYDALHPSRSRSPSRIRISPPEGCDELATLCLAISSIWAIRRFCWLLLSEAIILIVDTNTALRSQTWKKSQFQSKMPHLKTRCTFYSRHFCVTDALRVTSGDA